MAVVEIHAPVKKLGMLEGWFGGQGGLKAPCASGMLLIHCF